MKGHIITNKRPERDKQKYRQNKTKRLVNFSRN